MLKITQQIQQLQAAQDTINLLEPQMEQIIVAPAYIEWLPNGTHAKIWQDGGTYITLQYNQLAALRDVLIDKLSEV